MITREMSIGQVMEIDRTMAPILMEYGMHCFGCPGCPACAIDREAQ